MKDEQGNYKFVDGKIEYELTQDGKMFMLADGERWAEIHKRDVEFMAKRFGFIGECE